MRSVVITTTASVSGGSSPKPGKGEDDSSHLH